MNECIEFLFLVLHSFSSRVFIWFSFKLVMLPTSAIKKIVIIFSCVLRFLIMSFVSSNNINVIISKSVVGNPHVGSPVPYWHYRFPFKLPKLCA